MIIALRAACRTRMSRTKRNMGPPVRIRSSVAEFRAVGSGSDPADAPCPSLLLSRLFAVIFRKAIALGACILLVPGESFAKRRQSDFLSFYIDIIGILEFTGEFAFLASVQHGARHLGPAFIEPDSVMVDVFRAQRIR